MKKILIITIIGILFLSGAGATNIVKKENIVTFEINKSFSFSIPTIFECGNYLTVQLNETTKTLKESGKPEIPLFPYSFDLPFGSKNVKIICQTSDENKIELTKKILPTSEIYSPIFGNEDYKPKLIEDLEIYSSSNRYPATWFDYKITGGLNDKNEHMTHVSLYLFPVQYSPSENEIFSLKSIRIKIIYEMPINLITFKSNYDLVIITPATFSNILQQLVNHKNNQGIKTYLKTTDDIYNEYSGFDKPEQIKYFIKNAIETEGVKYVLLVGGLKKYFNANDRDDANQGTRDWYLPVRYTNIVKSGDVKDYGAISDLYFADIYDGEGNFSSWDSNSDGIYAKWSNTPGKDILDLNPDVYTSRISCRSESELKTIVNKIINYESTTPSSESWYKRMIGIAGMSFEIYKGQPDGEYLADLAFDYINNIIDEKVKIYASNKESGGAIPIKKYIINAFNQGARFILFSGHGHPLRWDTHPVGDATVWMGGIHIRNMWALFNKEKLPIVVVEGCHNSQFNVTIMKTLLSSNDLYDEYYWTHGDPGAICFNEKMMVSPYGGAIATIGGTALTTSYTGDPNTLNSELASNFFYEVGQNNASTFGEAFHRAFQKFIDENSIKQLEAHAITIWTALGDPSLQIV